MDAISDSLAKAQRLERSPTFMERVLGIRPKIEADIQLPYDGPWRHVPPEIRIALTRAAEANGLDVDQLFRQAQTESQFDPTAGNPSGAQGLMQLMPLMQKHYGVTDPTDPWQSAMAGGKYMRELIDKYHGDNALALAAYNAGPTAVRKAGNKVPKFKETQEYVKKILGVK